MSTTIPPVGTMRILGTIETVERRDRDSRITETAVHERAMLVVFDSVEEFRKAMSLGECSLVMPGSAAE